MITAEISYICHVIVIVLQSEDQYSSQVDYRKQLKLIYKHHLHNLLTNSPVCGVKTIPNPLLIFKDNVCFMITKKSV